MKNVAITRRLPVEHFFPSAWSFLGRKVLIAVFYKEHSFSIFV